MSKKSAAALVLTLVVSLPMFALGRDAQTTPAARLQQVTKKVKRIIVRGLEDLIGATIPKP